MPGDITVPNAAYTPTEMVAFITNAIAEITVYGKANGLRNNMLTRADLDDLRKLLDYYNGQIASSQGIAHNQARIIRKPRASGSSPEC